MSMTSSFSAAMEAILTGSLLHAGHVVLPFVLFALGVLCWLRVEINHTHADPA